MPSEKSFLPLCLDVRGRKILLVGGGRVAIHKQKTIAKYTDHLTVVAPDIADELSLTSYTLRHKKFAPSDLDGVFLAYACTNDPEVNAYVAESAAQRGVLFNVCDDPEASQFVSPAVYKDGEMSVAVSSNGNDVKRSLRWRQRIAEVLKNDPL